MNNSGVESSEWTDKRRSWCHYSRGRGRALCSRLASAYSNSPILNKRFFDFTHIYILISFCSILSLNMWVIPPGWGKLCDTVSLLRKVDVPFTIIIMSAHSWVIPPGWGKLGDTVSLLRR